MRSLNVAISVLLKSVLRPRKTNKLENNYVCRVNSVDERKDNNNIEPELSPEVS